MRVVLVLLVLTCCVALSNATFGLLQSKLKPRASVHQIARYRTVRYPVVVPEPATTYARPVSTYVSTYSVSSPSVVAVPYAYETTYSSPVPTKSVTVSPAVVQYEPETVYLEPYYAQSAFELCS